MQKFPFENIVKNSFKFYLIIKNKKKQKQFRIKE